jgi:hypothetical protein
MSGSVTGSDTPSMLERDLRGTFLNTGAGQESVAQVEAEARGVTVLEAE